LVFVDRCVARGLECTMVRYPNCRKDTVMVKLVCTGKAIPAQALTAVEG